MLIIVDHRIPQEALLALEKHGEVYLFHGESTVYKTIESHPDIFLFQADNHLILAPQCPESLRNRLNEKRIPFEEGLTNLGDKYPQTAAYNVAYGDGMYIGNEITADPKIMQLSKSKKWIQSPQGYARCNTLILNRSFVITSEPTVYPQIPNSLFVDPTDIVLQGFKHGFFGGCTGLYNNKVFLMGSVKNHRRGEQLANYVREAGFEIIELYQGPLMDVGGIFFLKSNSDRLG
jgi:hypothetical protein